MDIIEMSRDMSNIYSISDLGTLEHVKGNINILNTNEENDINSNMESLYSFDDERNCLRGAAWPDEEQDAINLTNRWPSKPSDRFKCYGFRCVLAPVD